MSEEESKQRGHKRQMKQEGISERESYNIGTPVADTSIKSAGNGKNERFVVKGIQLTLAQIKVTLLNIAVVCSEMAHLKIDGFLHKFRLPTLKKGKKSIKAKI